MKTQTGKLQANLMTTNENFELYQQADSRHTLKAKIYYDKMGFISEMQGWLNMRKFIYSPF